MIKEQFQQYRDTAYPDGVLQNHEKQLEQAFFAAYILCFIYFTQELPKFEEAVGVTKITELEKELIAFYKAHQK